MKKAVKVLFASMLGAILLISRAGAQSPPLLVTNAPASGTFYLLSVHPSLPFPFDPYFGALPIYSYDGVFFVDDSQVGDLQLQQNALGGEMMTSSLPGPGPGGGSTNNGPLTNICAGPTNFTVIYQLSTTNTPPYGTNDLWLQMIVATNNVANLIIHTPTTNSFYDVFGTTNLSPYVLPLNQTNWTWLQRASGTATEFAWTNITPCEAWFRLGTMLDEDGDGISSAYEKLVTATNPNRSDTDGDGISDGSEILIGRNPLVADSSPLAIHITNGLSGTVTRPFIQIQGYSETRLAEITYMVLTNGVVSETGNAWVRDQHYDMASGKFTTNWFQAYDLELAPGTNRVILQFSNYSNVVTAIELEYHLDYSAASNAPTLLSQWPTNGAVISGTNFTLRGYVDDPTASIHATITSANGTVTETEGDMERDGLFWVDNLPLTNGTSTVTLALTNAAGLGRSQSFTVTKSSVQLTIGSIGDVGAAYPVATVSGTIDTSGYTVWVNGVKATNTSATSWSAANVPVTVGGTATFHVSAIENSDNGGHGDTNGVPPGPPNNVQSPNPNSSLALQLSADREKASEIYVQRYEMSDQFVYSVPGGCLDNSRVMNSTTATHWERGPGGNETTATHTWDCLDTFDYTAEVAWDVAGVARFRDQNDSDAWSAWRDNNDGNPLHGPPNNNWEHSDAVHTHPVEDGVTLTHSRKGAAQIELFTGGRAGIKRQNIFTLAPTATEVDEYGATVGQIPKDKIKLLGKQLAADGKLYFVFPDNTTVNVTPEVTTNAPRYFFNVEKTKHNVAIIGNGLPLKTGRNANLALYSVGQSVVFRTYIYPEIPGLQIDHHWGFSGTHLNAYTSHETDNQRGSFSKWKHTCYPVTHTTTGAIGFEDGPDEYFMDAALKTLPATGAWWFNDGIKSAVCVLSLRFSNGQSASITPSGFFRVHRPSLNLTNIQRPRYFEVRAGDLGTGLATRLSLGDGDGNGNMYYSVLCRTKFSGKLHLTQLATVNYSGGTISGTDCLDGGHIDYNWTSDGLYSEAVVEPGILSGVTFQDGPANQHLGLPVRLEASFKQYLRFKPDAEVEAPNIYVTLGRIFWRVKAIVTEVEIDPAETPDPTEPDSSSEPPFWNCVFPHHE
ncbi:MAG TPA: hypothetical protein VGF13_09550 [Verrucomicrobiae bacterium]